MATLPINKQQQSSWTVHPAVCIVRSFDDLTGPELGLNTQSAEQRRVFPPGFEPGTFRV